MTVDVAMASVVCAGTRWDAKAALFAIINGISAGPEGGVASTTPGGQKIPAVRRVSLSGADAAHLVLHNVDLTAGRFFGTIHLDQLRLEGHCSRAPAGPRWTKRHALAKEHHWRAAQHHPTWTPAPGEAELLTPGGARAGLPAAAQVLRGEQERT